jgi:hypothetical protein
MVQSFIRESRWFVNHHSVYLYYGKHGLGLKLAIDMRNNFAVTEYAGDLFDSTEFGNCPHDCISHLFSLGEGNLVISGYKDPLKAMCRRQSSLGSSINHSKEAANCRLEVISDNRGPPRAYIVTIGDLAKGTPLFLDYGTYAFDRHHAYNKMDMAKCLYEKHKSSFDWDGNTPAAVASMSKPIARRLRSTN